MGDNSFISRIYYFALGFAIAFTYMKYFGVEKQIIEVPVLRVDPDTLITIAHTSQKILMLAYIITPIIAVIITLYFRP